MSYLIVLGLSRSGHYDLSLKYTDGRSPLLIPDSLSSDSPFLPWVTLPIPYFLSLPALALSSLLSLFHGMHKHGTPALAFLCSGLPFHVLYNSSTLSYGIIT